MAIWSLLSRPPAAARPSDLWFWAEPCEVASLAGAEMAESQRFHVVLSNQNNCENTILEGEKKKKTTCNLFSGEMISPRITSDHFVPNAREE